MAAKHPWPTSATQTPAARTHARPLPSGDGSQHRGGNVGYRSTSTERHCINSVALVYIGSDSAVTRCTYDGLVCRNRLPLPPRLPLRTFPCTVFLRTPSAHTSRAQVRGIPFWEWRKLLSHGGRVEDRPQGAVCHVTQPNTSPPPLP